MSFFSVIIMMIDLKPEKQPRASLKETKDMKNSTMDHLAHQGSTFMVVQLSEMTEIFVGQPSVAV